MTAFYGLRDADLIEPRPPRRALRIAGLAVIEAIGIAVIAAVVLVLGGVM